MMPFEHPQLETIHRYTARRLQCQPADVTGSGTTIVTATPRAKTNFMQPRVVKDPTLIHLFEYVHSSILRIHAQPTNAVKIALDELQPAIASGAKIEKENLLTLQSVSVEICGPSEPYFYLVSTDFRAHPHNNVRQLTLGDRALIDEFHQAIDERMRWFVEIDHPVVFGIFDDKKLVAVASQILFEDEHIAAAGVLTHPAQRQRGYGVAVVSAAVTWALARDWIVEWSTWAGNLGSLGIARALGFRHYSNETEFRLT